jgi:hypothetical protein
MFGLVAAALLVTSAGCTSRAGAAAVVGGDRIEVSALKGLVERGTNTASLQAFSGAEGLQRRELTLLVRRDLTARVAARLGVTVSAQQVGKVGQDFASQAGGQKAFEQQVEQSGIAPQDLPAALRDEALRQAIVAKLSKDATTGDTLYAQQLQREAKTARVAISPRFGAWDNATVAVVAATDKLSTPATGSGALSGQ